AAVHGGDGELVRLAVANRRDVRLPDARMVPARVEDVGAGRPAVPLSDHGDGARVRGPDGEMRAGLRKVAAELPVEVGVRAFPEEIDVVLGQHRHGAGELASVNGDVAGAGRAWRE